MNNKCSLIIWFQAYQMYSLYIFNDVFSSFLFSSHWQIKVAIGKDSCQNIQPFLFFCLFFFHFLFCSVRWNFVNSSHFYELFFYSKSKKANMGLKFPKLSKIMVAVQENYEKLSYLVFIKASVSRSWKSVFQNFYSKSKWMILCHISQHSCKSLKYIGP